MDIFDSERVLTIGFFMNRLKDAARETAKRAKELAQEKAGPIYAACEGVRSWKWKSVDWILIKELYISWIPSWI